MAFSVRSVLVTGASRGLGLEFIKQIVALPSAPEVVIAACRDPSSASILQDIAKSNSSVKVVKLDVEKDDDIENAFTETQKHVGDFGLNILINNAGMNDKADGGGIFQANRQRLQRHFDVNVSGPIMLVEKFLPLIQLAATQKRSKELNCQAAIFNMSSILGSQTVAATSPQNKSLHYKCSKTAITMASIVMAHELSDAGIYVSALHPGWVQTDMGGSNAPVVSEDSIAGCLKVIGGASQETAGKLINWKGEVLPY